MNSRCECVCSWFPVMDWLPVQGVFLFGDQCSQGKLWIYREPDQDDVVTEDE